MGKLLNPWELSQAFSSKRIDVFAREILGIELHQGQAQWVNEAWKVINILNPANQWGKTLVEAVLHIYQACTKPMLAGRVKDADTWFSIQYRTLNTAKTYEIARGVMELVWEIVQGELLLPSGETNKSLLKDWAIYKYVDTTNSPPHIKWWNNSETLFRSYDDLGSSFKRLKLAFVSVDECGDIPEVELFLNGTLLPRIAFYQGRIHMVGTHQPKGIEYHELVNKAEMDMKHKGSESDYYVQHGTLYENPFMSREYIEKIENIADEELRKQIIYGQYVDNKDHFFSYDEVDNAFRLDMPYNPETGFSEAVDPLGRYVMSVDLAATEDETAVSVLRYGITVPSFDIKGHRIMIELPYRLVFHKAFKGKTVPVSMQYELIKHWYSQFTRVAKGPRQVAFLFDAGSLGGKNAADAFSDLHGYEFPGPKKSYPQEKAEAVGTLKEILGRGRRVVGTNPSDFVDLNKNWGFLRASSRMKELRRQFETYALEDKGIRQDRIATVYMAVHWIEKRKPRLSHNRATDFDIYKTLVN